MEAYQVQLFYHLAGLRQLHNEEICDALRNAGGISQNLQGWCRIVDYQYSMHPLSARGSLIKGGRFNIGADLDRNSQPTFPALYCAGDYETAYLEKFGASDKGSDFAGHEFALRNLASFSLVQLNGIVKNVFDLRNESNLKAFMTVMNNFGLPDELKKLARELGIPMPYLVTNTHLLNLTFLTPDWRSLRCNLEPPPIHRFLVTCFVMLDLKVFSIHLQKETRIAWRYIPKISMEVIHMWSWQTRHQRE